MKSNWKKEQQKCNDNGCAAYFREFPVFDRLLKGFRGKYHSYGCFAGTVVLRNLTGEDIEALEGFFLKNYHGRKSVSISAGRFAKALKESRFSDLEPRQLLEEYFQEEMTGKKERMQAEENAWAQMVEDVRGKAGTPQASEWVEEIGFGQNPMNIWLKKRYRESGKDIEEARAILELGIRIIHAFPCEKEKTEYLAVFAAMLTGNPHAFDDVEKGGQLLNLLVKWNAERKNLPIERSEIFPALYRQKVYLAAGILRDDISNYAQVCGIQVQKKDGTLHPGMEGFQKEGEPVQVPLSVIVNWKSINCIDRTIYIVENPSVYAMLCGKWQGKKSFMCMNGQPRLSALLILDLLAAERVKIYYGGDLDPEGLLIAQKLKRYYQAEFHYWHMFPKDYAASRSDEIISEKRLKMLDRIEDVELQETAEEIRKQKTAGYQERIDYLHGDF